jgi:hypothetical protein
LISPGNDEVLMMMMNRSESSTSDHLDGCHHPRPPSGGIFPQNFVFAQNKKMARDASVNKSRFLLFVDAPGLGGETSQLSRPHRDKNVGVFSVKMVEP